LFLKRYRSRILVCVMPERKSFFCRTPDAGEMSRPAVFGCGNGCHNAQVKK
jgi:hypothetical protein